MRDIRVRELPRGYEFRPTDEELVGYYLMRKIQGIDFEVDQVIAEIDICKFEPWILCDKSKIKSDDPEWFFISPPVKKYANSKRMNRATDFGHWKVTGKERYVTNQKTKTVIGKKRTLVFYEGHSSSKNNCSKKTDWVLHEYRLIEDLPNQKELVLYRLKDKSDENIDSPKFEDSDPGGHMTTDFEDQAVDDATPKIDTPTCEESESTNHITTDFNDETALDTTQKIDTPKCEDNGSSSNVMTDSENQAIFDYDMNEELGAILSPNLDDLSSLMLLLEQFEENESNALVANRSYSDPPNKLQFSAGAIQQKEDLEEYYYNETTNTCFNAYPQQTSLKRPYVAGGESNDTDTEAIQRQFPSRELKNGQYKQPYLWLGRLFSKKIISNIMTRRNCSLFV